MLLGVKIFDLYITTRNKTPEVMILDCNVFCAGSNLRRNREWDCPLIVFVNCDWIFENTEQYR